MRVPELSIVIPAFNEGGHLEEVVSAMAKAFERSAVDYEICAVNNGSTDQTGAVIESLHRENEHIVGITFEKNQGYGGAILSGLALVRGTTVGWADADGQVDPEDIVRLYRDMSARGYSLAKAVRTVRPESYWRKAQSKIYEALFQFIFWTPYRDINAKPKLMTREAAKILGLRSRDFFLDPEFVIRALRSGMPICEIGTVWHERRSGETRIHVLAGVQFLKNMLAYRLRFR